MNIIANVPPIIIQFNPNLLSAPTFGYNAENLLKIADFLERKILRFEFRKFPETVGRLIVKHLKFMELYERAKNQERENKTKTHLKTQWLGYRPRLADKNGQRVFERLADRAKTSKYDRGNNTI